MTPPSPDDASPHHRPVLRYFIVATGGLFAIVAGFYGLENFGGQRAWDQEKARLAAAGESLDLADFFPDPSSVPDDENGATVSIFVDVCADPSGTRFDVGSVFDVFAYGSADKGSPTTGTAPDFQSNAKALIHQPKTARPSTTAQLAQLLLKALSAYDADFAEITEAQDRPHFIVTVDLALPHKLTLGHIRLAMNYAQIASYRATCHIAAGQHDDALRDTRSTLHSVKFTSEPALISFIVTLTTLQNGIRPLWYGLSQEVWTPSDLRQLDSDLAAIQLNDRLMHTLRGERAIFCATLDAYANDRDLASEGLLMFSGLLPISGHIPTDLHEFAERTVIKIAPKGWFQRDQVTHIRNTDHFIHSISSAPFGAPPSISTTKLSPYNWCAEQLASGTTLVCSKARHADAILAQARTAIAIELFRQSSGHLPTSLAELSPAPPPDPMTGAPLLYERVDDSRYKLWSVATNGLDDGGETGPSSSTARALDWVWQSWINEETEKADN